MKYIQVKNTKYRILTSLARGGMGEIFLVQNTANGQLFALKHFFVYAFHCQEDCENYWQREQKIMQIQSRSPVRAIKLIDAFSIPATEGQFDYFLLMEHIQGITLKEWVRQRPRMPTQQEILWRLRKIILPLCQHLAFVHAQGIIHRDITPSNIMIITENKTIIPVLIDWGVAKLQTTTHISRPISETRATVISSIGNPPEVLLGLEPVIASDIFMVGYVLYFLLTAGQTPRPYQKADYGLDPVKINPQVWPNLAQLVIHMTQFESEARLQTFSDVMNQLQEDSSTVSMRQNKTYLRSGISLDSPLEEILSENSGETFVGDPTLINERGDLQLSPTKHVHSDSESMKEGGFSTYSMEEGEFSTYSQFQEAKRRGFHTYAIMQEANEKGFPTYAIMQEALKKGFPTYAIMQKAKEGGFPTYADMQKATGMGFTTFELMLKNDPLIEDEDDLKGFPSYLVMLEAKEKGFPTYALMQEAKKLGIPTYLIMQEMKETRCPSYAIFQKVKEKGFPTYAIMREAEEKGFPVYAIMEEAKEKGFPTYAIMQEAEEKGFPTYTVMEKAYAKGFPTFNLMEKAKKYGFPTYAIMQEAEKKGFPTYATIEEAYAKGFPTFKIMEEAKEKGFPNYWKMLEAEKNGFPTFQIMEEAKEKGFPNYSIMQNAAKMGFSTYERMQKEDPRVKETKNKSDILIAGGHYLEAANLWSSLNNTTITPYVLKLWETILYKWSNKQSIDSTERKEYKQSVLIFKKACQTIGYDSYIKDFIPLIQF